MLSVVMIITFLQISINFIQVSTNFFQKLLSYDVLLPKMCYSLRTDHVKIIKNFVVETDVFQMEDTSSIQLGSLSTF